jgi:uncharacterized membrane protein YidH (DUF202 family)
MQYTNEEPLVPGGAERPAGLRERGRQASVLQAFSQQVNAIGLAALQQGSAQFPSRSTPMEIHWQFARTELANERTFLAWVRTALSMFSIGFGILKVEKAGAPLQIEWYDAGIGFMFMFAACLSVYAGVQRYYAVDRGLSESIGVVKTFDRMDIKTVIVTLAVVVAASTLRTVVCLIV